MHRPSLYLAVALASGATLAALTCLTHDLPLAVRCMAYLTGMALAPAALLSLIFSAACRV